VIRPSIDLLHFKVKHKQQKPRPFLRWIFIIFLVIVALWLVREILFFTPYLAERSKMFVEVNKQLNMCPEKAVVLEKKNYYQKIINNLLKIVTKNPTHEQAYILLGKAYWLRSRIEEEPVLRQNLINKGILFLRKGFAISPKFRFGEGHYILGELYYEKGKDWYFEALSEYRKAKRLGFYGKDMEKRIAYILLEKEEYGQAVKAWQTVLSSNKDPESYLFCGVAFYNTARTDLAEQYFNYAVEMYRENPEKWNPEFLALSWFWLGKMYHDKKIYDVAEKYYKKALQISPDNLEFLKKLSELYNEIHNIKAVKDIEIRIKSLSSSPLTEKRKR